MKCPSCGVEVADNSKFCSNCGAMIGHITDEGEKRGNDHVTFINEPLSGDYVRSTTLSARIKRKLASFWKNLSLFSKVTTIALAVVIILLVISICVGKAWAIVISSVQFCGLVVALLMHANVIKLKQKWISYLILVVAILLSALNVMSYSWGANRNQPSTNPSNNNQTQHGNETPEKTENIDIMTPRSAESCAGMDYEVLINELEEAGFIYIEAVAIEDLSKSEMEAVGTVETISIDGEESFIAGQKYTKNSEVIIRYHLLAPVATIPYDAKDCIGKKYTQVKDDFHAAGFKNVELEKVEDLTSSQIGALDTVQSVYVEQDTEFEKGQEISDKATVVIRYHALRKCAVTIHIDFIANWIFSKYDVTLLVNGEEQGTMPHGTDSDFELTVEAGEYTFTFVNEDSSSVKGETTITIDGNMELEYRISCYYDEVEVKTLSTKVLECAASEHSWTPAACTTPATCLACGKIDGESLGHTWVDATCTLAKTCSVCNATEGKPKGHAVSEWTTVQDETCGTDGAEAGTCSVCSEKVDQIIPKTGKHTYGEWDVVQPTSCSAAGKKVRVCSTCQAEEAASIAMLSHEYKESVVKEATYYEPGEKGQKCSVCGAVGKTTEYYTYYKTTLKAIFDEYRANEMAAEDKYVDDMYIEFTAKISAIESGSIFSYGTVVIEVDNGSWYKDEVSIAIKSSEQRDYIKTLSAGDSITVRGLLKSVIYDPDFGSYMSVNMIEIVGATATSTNTKEPDTSTATTESTETVLTVDNCKDLENLISLDWQKDRTAISNFVSEHKGDTVKLEMLTAYVEQNGNYKTRFNYTLYAVDGGNVMMSGPVFMFEDVNYSDLHLVGSNIPDTFGIGIHCNVKATIVGFEDGMILLDPEAITVIKVYD